MKILNLKIISPQMEIKRDIDFKESGVSIILADIKEKDETKETINSLGKTLLLKMIDYLFGSNNDPVYFKEEINDYIIKGIIKNNGETFSCSRIIGDCQKNIINKKPYTLDEYKTFFSISRRILNKQIFLKEKSHLISDRQNPSCHDYIDFLSLLKLKDIDKKTKEIYETQDLIKSLKENRKHLLGSYQLSELKELEEEMFLLDKEVEEYEKNLTDITKKIENIQITDLKESVFEEYSIKNSKSKEIKRKIERNKIEKKRLKQFIKESNKTDIKSQDVIAIYEQAMIEVPDMVKREMEQVQEFHEKVYLERKEYLLSQIVELEESYTRLELEFEKITHKINKLGELISENKAYKEAIMYYEKYARELNDLKFKQGQLSQLKNIQKKIDNNSSQLTKKFEEAKNILETQEGRIDSYSDFIYGLVRLIYNEDVSAFFGISIKKRHQTRRPIAVKLTLRGDTGEGVGNVGKLLVDYMIFNYNEEVEILIHDSSCYNGIDPRQVASMIRELDSLAKNVDKQAILSLNKYQVAYDKDNDKFIKENASLILSEKDNLLGFLF